MKETVSEAQLVAYVDGELETAEMRRIERLLEEDIELRETVRQLRESTASLRGAYQATLAEAVPARIYETIDRTLGEVAPNTGLKRIRSSPWPLAMAVAASLLLAFPMGFLLADYLSDQRLERQAARLDSDRDARLAALHSSLERQVSGEKLAWRNPESGALGEVIPVRTFKSASGRWCREYESRVERDGTTETERGIACREATGDWRRRVLLVEES